MMSPFQWIRTVLARFTIEVYEGTFVTQTFTVDTSNPQQKFILPNSGIDTDTLSVIVKDTELSTVSRKFELFDSLFNVTKITRSYFIHEISQERYELLFGDGIFGVKLDNSNFIQANIHYFQRFYRQQYQ